MLYPVYLLTFTTFPITFSTTPLKVLNNRRRYLGFADEAHFIPEAAMPLFVLHCVLLLHEACTDYAIVRLQAEILIWHL